MKAAHEARAAAEVQATMKGAEAEAKAREEGEAREVPRLWLKTELAKIEQEEARQEEEKARQEQARQEKDRIIRDRINRARNALKRAPFGGRLSVPLGSPMKVPQPKPTAAQDTQVAAVSSSGAPATEALATEADLGV